MSLAIRLASSMVRTWAVSEFLGVRGASLKVFYDGRFGDTIEEHAAGAKASVPF
jgi:hypothetical protein